MGAVPFGYVIRSEQSKIRAEIKDSVQQLERSLPSKFISHRDAEIMLATKNELNAVAGLHNLHAADSSVHHERSEVVTKDLYQSNRMTDRAEVSELKIDIKEIHSKIDILLERILTAE